MIMSSDSPRPHIWQYILSPTATLPAEFGSLLQRAALVWGIEETAVKCIRAALPPYIKNFSMVNSFHQAAGQGAIYAQQLRSGLHGPLPESFMANCSLMLT
jgi:hypothetical protein